MLGIVGGLIIIPCLFPCIMKLVQAGIQNMQFTPVSVGKDAQTPLMLFKVKTTPILSAAEEAVRRLEGKTQINRWSKRKRGDCEKCECDSCQVCGHCIVCETDGEKDLCDECLCQCYGE